MKNIFAIAAVLMLNISATAQNNSLTGIIPGFNFYSRGLSFYVEPKYDRTVNEEMLNNAKLISDIVDGYPSNWISDYVSVEIIATCHGEVLEATGLNEKLNNEQISILKSADLGSEIIIKVTYKNQDLNASNSSIISLDSKLQTINFKIPITPETEVEAAFVGGNNLMNSYLMENTIHKIPGVIARKIKTAQVTFTINEKGKIENAKISKSSNDPSTDKLLVDAITAMPDWKPAKNSKGIPVKQDFKFSVGDYGC